MIPQLALTAIRYIFIAAAQMGVFAAAQMLMDKGLNAIRDMLISKDGGSPEQAEESIALEIVSILSGLGASAALIRSRLPLRWADKIAKLPTARKAAAEAAGKAKPPIPAATLGETLGKGILTVTGGLLIWNVLTDWVWVGNSLGFLPTEQQQDIQKRALTIKQLIDAPKSIMYSAEKSRKGINQQERALIKETADQAESQIEDLRSSYSQKFVLYGRDDVRAAMQTSLTTLMLELQTLRQMAGLIPRKPIEIAKTEAKVSVVVDGDTLKLDNGETVRLVGIDAPESTTQEGEISKKYLKERLAGQMVRVESDPDHLIDMYGRRLGVIFLGDTNINIEMLQKHYATFYEFEPNALVFKKPWQAAAQGFSPSSGGVSVLSTSSPASTRIYTGVISTGTLGAPSEFIARPNDMIQGMEDLKAAVKNNLASFVQALPGRFYYEIGIVPSIRTRGGFSQKGAAVRVISSYTKIGEPRYKTIYHKFAVMKLGVSDENGRTVKLAQINLGPVDATSFQPTSAQLTDLSKTITPELFTSDVREIREIITPVAVNVTATPPSNPNPPTLPLIPAATQAPPAVLAIPGGAQAGSAAEAAAPPPAVVAAPPAPSPPPPLSAVPLKIQAATNLSEFYAALGASLPPLNMRAKYYAAKGLGAESTYVGSAEQNNRLLAAFKAEGGV